MANVHLLLGAVIVLAALAAVFSAPARRVVVYLLVLQIVLGVMLWWSTKDAPPVVHWVLALLVGGIYPMANALERRGRPRSTIVTLSALGALIFAYIFYVGIHSYVAIHARRP